MHNICDQCSIVKISEGRKAHLGDHLDEWVRCMRKNIKRKKVRGCFVIVLCRIVTVEERVPIDI